MAEENLKQEIAELNQKVDLLLEYVNQQRLSAKSIEDLLNDGAIIGKDVYDSTVDELDKRQVEVHPTELTNLGVSFLRNINNFNLIMNSFESLVDLSKDLTPIINESLIDLTKWMAEMEAKGYFDLLNKLKEISDEVLSQVKLEDLQKFQEQLPQWIELVKSLSSEKLLFIGKSVNQSINNTDLENIQPLGALGLLRSLNHPEMKKTLGLMVSLAKNFNKQ